MSRHTPTQYDTPCVNTILMDRHTNLQDQRDSAFEYAYKHVHALCVDELEKASCREDIEDDILFEAQSFIDTNNVHDADYNEVAERLFEDYSL